ncbi:beta-propeller fold lactonase family protein [Nonomuraea sp. NPDC026600]|uniref:beta-propeller fold lactonase family protein n=1 Tax=Nonomuraea sp. NPDC026600 TaxID=3155363 RepID=UPI0033FBD5BF
MRSSLRRTGAAAVGLFAVMTTLVSPALAAGEPATRALYVSGLVSRDVSIFGIRPGGGLDGPRARVRTGGGSRGIVLAPDGRTAYVAVGFDPGTEIDANKVETYRVVAGGGLVRLAPPVAANGGPVSLAITPDGRALYLTNRDSGTLSVFSVARDGKLTQVGDPVPSGAVEPQGLAVTPDGRFLFVSHRGVNETDKDVVTRFVINADSTLTSLGRPAKIGKSGGAMAITPDGRFLYVPSSLSKQVFGFRVGADGSLVNVPGSPYFAPDFPISATTTPDGRHLYVTDGGILESGSRKVSAFAIRADGGLTRLPTAMAGDSPGALTTTPDGRHLYVSNLDSDDVSAFDIAAGGGLKEIDGSPFKLAPGEQPALQAVAVSPDQGPSAAFTEVDGRFDASASTDPDGQVTRYDWDFGDGTRLPDGGPNPAHALPGPGTFTVTLTVTDDEGCSTRVVHTGSSALCNGSPAAQTTRTISVG